MIQFGKSYYYSKENVVVFPMVVEEERIICTDSKGNSYVVLDQKYLIPTAKAPKKVITPKFITPPKLVVATPVITKSTVAADVAGEPTPATTVNVANSEPELVSTQQIVLPPPDTSILNKKVKIVVEESYI